MVREGEKAPRFELPGVRNGEFERVTLGETIGEAILVLAFYPGDFDPVCNDFSTGLDDLALLSMQRDISVFGLSGDSVFSHRAFAEEYDLRIPLLSDVDGAVAAEYGVLADDDRYLTDRAVFVVNHAGDIEYAWVAENIDELPLLEEIRAVIEGIGDDATAESRYREGYIHYEEGRETFTSAMGNHEERQWLDAEREFSEATAAFGVARDEFETAARFAENPTTTAYFEQVKRKAASLWQAADWLSDAASAFASGEGRQGDGLRQDAEGPLETARKLPEPLEPEELPPDEDVLDEEFRDDHSTGDEVELELDESGAIEETDTTDQHVHEREETSTADESDEDTSSQSSSMDDEEVSDFDNEGESDFDDAELEAITAEVEQQTGASPATEDSGLPSESADEPDAQNIDGELDDDDLELELVDPTESDADSDADSNDSDDDSEAGENSEKREQDIPDAS